MPTRATDQKSATISEIQRSHIRQGKRLAAEPRCRPFQNRPQRIDEIEQSRSLVPDFMHQRRRDAGADHALARHPYDGDRILAAAGQARARAPDRGADVTIEIANDRRRLVIARQLQRIGGDDIEAAQPHAGLVLAALRDDVGKHVELGQHDIEPEAQHREPALRFFRCRVIAGGLLQPAQELVQQATQLAAPDDQVACRSPTAQPGSSAAAGNIGSCNANDLTIASRAIRERVSCSSIALV